LSASAEFLVYNGFKLFQKPETNHTIDTLALATDAEISSESILYFPSSCSEVNRQTNQPDHMTSSGVRDNSTKTDPQGNQELLVVRDKVGRPQLSLG